MSRWAMLRRVLWLAPIVLPVTMLAAQQSRATRWLESCRDRRWRDYVAFCETRELTLPVTKSLSIDGRQNGGVDVHGWDRNEIRVVAMVQAQDESEAAARDLAKQVNVMTSGGDVRADGPRRESRRQSWSVDYEIWVPRNTDLRMSANNGGLSVDGVDSRMDLETTNGGLNLTDVDGDVRGSTTNGGVTIQLAGDRWRGPGLDVRTTNGGVHLIVPNNYSARLETGTVNGGMDINFPITVQGSIGRRLTTQLGNGGATIRAVTTNGGVTIQRR
jgi:DUF4097 and DUF4098 domain-containing protein YvlB